MKSLALLIVLTLVSINAQAVVIVDTGGNASGTNYILSPGQYFAGQFTTDLNYTVSDVSAFFSSSSAGDLTLGIYNNSSDNVGTAVFEQSFSVAANSTAGWYGLSGLNWSLASGTYWIALIPDSVFGGIHYGNAPSPLDDYVLGSTFAPAGWRSNDGTRYDQLELGFRIEEHTVPTPAPLALLGLGLAAFGYTRKRNA